MILALGAIVSGCGSSQQPETKTVPFDAKAPRPDANRPPKDGPSPQ